MKISLETDDPGVKRRFEDAFRDLRPATTRTPATWSEQALARAIGAVQRAYRQRYALPKNESDTTLDCLVASLRLEFTAVAIERAQTPLSVISDVISTERQDAQGAKIFEERLVTIEELAVLLHVSQRRIRKCDLPFVKVDRSIRYSLRAIDDLLAARFIADPHNPPPVEPSRGSKGAR